LGTFRAGPSADAGTYSPDSLVVAVGDELTPAVSLVLAGADVSTAGLADEGDVVDDPAGSDCPPQAVSASARATLSVPA